MGDRRESREQAPEGGEDNVQVPTEETGNDGEGSTARDRAPMRRDMSIPMAEHSGEEGEEDAVDKELSFLVRRICPAVLALIMATVAVVVTLKFGMESFVLADPKATVVVQIITVVVICAACACCASRLGTTWPLGIIYLTVPGISFGVIFGTIFVSYTDEDSFWVAIVCSVGFFIVAKIVLSWLSSWEHFVHPSGWLFSLGYSLGDATLPGDWAPVALSIYMDFAIISLLSLLLIGVRESEHELSQRWEEV